MITIVTDSTAYFSEKEIKENGIVIVPIKYNVKSREFFENYRDKNGEYLNLVNSNKNEVITEHISLSVFHSTFEQIIRTGSKVLCIILSSRLSGSYYNARLAAKEYGEDKVTVVDSLLSAGGLKLLTEKAALLCRESDDLKKIAIEVENIRNRIGIIFSVESMEPIKKSGRLGFVRQSMGTALNIRPILKCENGTIISAGVSRGFLDQMNKILECIPDNVEKIIVNCNNDVKNLIQFKSRLQSSFPNVPIEYNSFGPVLYIHLGKGTLAVSWIAGE